MANDPARLRNAFVAIVGERHVLHGSSLAALDVGYHPDNLLADCLVLPGSTAEISKIAALCENEGVGLVPQGGRTGLSGGTVSGPGNVIIGFSRMARIEKIDALGAIAIVEAGASLQAVEEAAGQVGLSVGIDLAARGTATIGGMISTNAGGMEAFRHGSMRHRIAGLEVVLASGEVIDEMTEVTKCNEGYDLKQLFCGAEGTLGIVTRAILRLVPETPSPIMLFLACRSASDALALMRACQMAADLDLLHAEIMWRSAAEQIANEIKLAKVLSFCEAEVYVILEVACRTDAAGFDLVFSEIVDTGGLEDNMIDGMIAKNERERRDIWLIRESSFAIDASIPNCVWFDVSVPMGKLDDYVAMVDDKLTTIDPALKAYVIGHLGDGNLHYTIGSGQPLSEAQKQSITYAVYDGLKDIGGSFSAEHGIGTEKRTSLHNYASPSKLRLMKEIKKAFDPNGTMNPGKIV